MYRSSFGGGWIGSQPPSLLYAARLSRITIWVPLGTLTPRALGSVLLSPLPMRVWIGFSLTTIAVLLFGVARSIKRSSIQLNEPGGGSTASQPPSFCSTTFTRSPCRSFMVA